MRQRSWTFLRALYERWPVHYNSNYSFYWLGEQNIMAPKTQDERIFALEELATHTRDTQIECKMRWEQNDELREEVKAIHNVLAPLNGKRNGDGSPARGAPVIINISGKWTAIIAAAITAILTALGIGAV